MTKHIDTWNFDASHWAKYVEVEKGNKKEDNVYFGIGILILGTIALVSLRSVHLLMALLFAIPLALLIPYLRQRFSYKYLKKHPKPSVKIYADRLVINSIEVQLIDSYKRIKSMKTISDDGILLLEFTVEWLTRKGPTFDEFRIPVPGNDKSMAHKIMSDFGFYSKK